MTLGEHLHNLRQQTGLSQDAVGAQGFVSTPGWIKLENDQRKPSEKLIGSLVEWLVKDKHIKPGAAKTLKEELLTLKYMGSNSPFLRELARGHAKSLTSGTTLLAESNPPRVRRRGRPPKKRA